MLYDMGDHKVISATANGACKESLNASAKAGSRRLRRGQEKAKTAMSAAIPSIAFEIRPRK